jgi:uncharacterized protein (TIGR02118 family)
VVRVHIWLKKKESMGTDEFRDYWVEKHAPIAGQGYDHLKGYVVDLVTRVPEGQQAPYDGVAELTWESREDFKADMASDAAKRATEDLGHFTETFGLLFIDQIVVK